MNAYFLSFASGPTLFMLLSREDAVDGWRSLMGPTDPTSAKEAAPETYVLLYFSQRLVTNII